MQNDPLWVQSAADLGDQLFDLIERLNGEKIDMGPLGMTGSGLEFKLFRHLMKAAGLDDDEWWKCKACNGEGRDLQYEEAYQAWEDYDPPEGDGFQLWETTSEGSPASPVFETLEALCEWCEDNATVFGRAKVSKEKWMEMLDANFVYHQDGRNIFL